MKPLFVIAVLTVSLAWTGPALAAASTPSAASVSGATSSADTKQLKIESLKERLATKVAELRQIQSKAMFGTVKSVSISTIVMETKTKDVKIDIIDEMTVAQILKGKKTKLSVEDIAKGDEIAVFGSYDATLDLLKATYIFIQNKPLARISGVVSDINRSDYTLAITSPEGRSTTVDIETTSRTVKWDRESGISKSGFSKIAVGDTLHIMGNAVPKKENRYSAVRILNLGNLTGAVPTATPSQIPAPEASASASQTLTPSPTSKAK